MESNECKQLKKEIELIKNDILQIREGMKFRTEEMVKIHDQMHLFDKVTGQLTLQDARIKKIEMKQ